MLNAYLQRLYTYNQWANERLLDLIEANPQAYTEEVQIAVSHYLAAMEIWIARISGRTPTIGGVWEKYDLKRCRELAAQASADWLALLPTLKSEADWHRRIAYKNTQGMYYETPVIDIICHAPNHATYHRAQIARMLRAQGVIPVNTDFITFARTFDLGV